MRERPAARLLISTPEQRILLFRFVHKTGALAGRDYWATPGGGVEQGESFADAAKRELHEETGILETHLSAPISESKFPLQLANGEHVLAIEQYFVVHVETESISREGWTADEVEVMAAHRWWSREELVTTAETVYPDGLVEMLDDAGVFGARAAAPSRPEDRFESAPPVEPRRGHAEP
ncbi:NUDIX hydrolase [Burkholderia plantarii]|uniref:NUDIX hydrolase n=1 Tax=Burkholderia plantarii TaxID=41899 RepID=UPI001F5BD45B|nr:NUDIX domain-containing protein [Burkholderia plantarii]